jgi:hypothetical protein
MKRDEPLPPRGVQLAVGAGCLLELAILGYNPPK